MNALRIGSMCTGYGGLDMAVQAVFGGEIAWHAEVDPDASKVLAHHHPDVPNLGDIKLIDWGQVEPVDALLAGYPCQPFSDAGLRLGVEDERHIWPWIVTAIRVLRPRLVILENVRGHLRRGFNVVLADLAGLRFDAEWRVVRASDIGAPHKRERLFIIATAQDADGAARGERRVAAPGQAAGGRPRADAGRRGRASAANASGEQPERWGSAGVLGSATAAEPREGDQRQRAGDATRDRGPAAADSDGTPWGLNVTGAGSSSVQGPAVTERTPEQPGRLHRGGRDEAPMAADTDWGVFESAIRRWEAVIGRPAPRPTEPGRTGERLSPAFVEWMMGIPAGHVTAVPGLSRNAQLRLLGNGVVWQQGAAALAWLWDRTEAA